MLFQSWKCTKCGKRHFENTDHRICPDFLACSVRARKVMEDRTDTYLPENYRAENKKTS